MITAERYHDFSAGHRVVGHEGACRFLHGHNYRVHFECAANPDIGDGIRLEPIDEVGRVLDFSQIKQRLCMWLEDNWDHKFLAWKEDPVMQSISEQTALAGFESAKAKGAEETLDQSIVWLPFNPTAENMAKYLVEEIGPEVLRGTGVALIRCCIEETRKCSATYSKG